ncbi:MAG: NAD(P)-dependent glycerol-3-phosphate dehydrogenase [Bacteroidetes bacterium]|nr:MAG: NAD(P)-dependent glycerol-3-phosphate dehydrogenase [Bacteroidota bacterium]
MNSNDTSKPTVGLIGAGSFGTALANMLAENAPVLLYARRPEVVEALRKKPVFKGRPLHPNISYTNELEEVAHSCNLIFPVVPSENFRELMQNLSPFLRPYHILIHGTKGMNIKMGQNQRFRELETLSRDQIQTMSELIREESVVLRIGCVAGPNLATEIADGQPAATVVASHFDEVIRAGKAVLRSTRFRVHDSHDLLGIELAGVLKNIMAIAAGILNGLGYGANTLALLITRGLAEIVTLGKVLGADPRAFLGLAGIGDLVATCSSPLSRNFTVGYRLAKGEKLDHIITDMEEVAEGLKTVCIARAIANYYKVPAPITKALYKTLFEEMDVTRGLRLLMEYPFTEDVEYI